jgi:polyisoprenoid-binding protein YceI
MRNAEWMIGLALLVALPAASQPRTIGNIAEGSSMRYHLVHPLHTIEAESKDVKYTLELDPASKVITKVTGHVDVTTFNSGNSSRDSHAMEVIDALTYPESGFVSTSITVNGDSLLVDGALTFHGVTKDVEIPARVDWSDHRVKVNGAFLVSLTAFGIERPSLLLIPVEDTLSFTFEATFSWSTEVPAKS